MSRKRSEGQNWPVRATNSAHHESGEPRNKYQANLTVGTAYGLLLGNLVLFLLVVVYVFFLFFLLLVNKIKWIRSTPTFTFEKLGRQKA